MSFGDGHVEATGGDVLLDLHNALGSDYSPDGGFVYWKLSDGEEVFNYTP
jgi:hypothetical protein